MYLIAHRNSALVLRRGPRTPFPQKVTTSGPAVSSLVSNLVALPARWWRCDAANRPAGRGPPTRTRIAGTPRSRSRRAGPVGLGRARARAPPVCPWYGTGVAERGPRRRYSCRLASGWSTPPCSDRTRISPRSRCGVRTELTRTSNVKKRRNSTMERTNSVFVRAPI